MFLKPKKVDLRRLSQPARKGLVWNPFRFGKDNSSDFKNVFYTYSISICPTIQSAYFWVLSV
jgi:hypothetical protein